MPPHVGCAAGPLTCTGVFATPDLIRHRAHPRLRREMTRALDVLMLLTDGFGGRGGIAKFNRDFLAAMDASAWVRRVRVLPRLIPEPIEEPIPESVVYDRRAAKGRAAFMLRLAAHARGDERLDLVICGWQAVNERLQRVKLAQLTGF